MSDDAVGPWFPGAHAATHPDRVAIIEAATGATRTYREVDDTANQMSRLLRRLGLEPGNHVSLWFDNDLDYPAIWWGARYAGLYLTLISTRLRPEEAAYIVQDSGSPIVVVGRRLADEHGDALRSLVGPEAKVIVDGDGPDELRTLLAGEPATPMEERPDGSPMLYSSGTTGRPKAVKRKLPGTPVGVSATAVIVGQRFGIDETSVYLSPAPLYHAAPFGYVSATLGIGGTVVLMSRFDAEDYLVAVERYGVTHSQVVPTMFVRLLALPEDVKARYDLSSLQVIIHSAAPCPIPIKKQMIQWWGPVISEYYSGTENVGYTICTSQEWLAHPGTVGRPVGCEIHIIGEDGVELTDGGIGTVYFSGGAGFEYHNDAATTQGSYLPNGWATFKDVGYVDADGFLYLTDRLDNMIIVGGVNVYPQEAENLLISHDSVADAAVFGIPHDEMGEEVKAVVQPAAGLVGGQELEAELIGYCREHLASVKCPRSIDFRSDLPREPTGKLLKRKLRDDYRAALAGDSTG